MYIEQEAQNQSFWRIKKAMQIIDDSYTLTMLAGFLLGWLACVLVRNSRRK